MTRINLVDPAILVGPHLMAEYRELPRVFTAVRKAVANGAAPSDYKIPEQYVLGKGHVTFFYNKIAWLMERYARIYQVLRQRGYDLDREIFVSVFDGASEIPHNWSEPYQPTPTEIYLNMARLAKRSNIREVTEELAA